MFGIVSSILFIFTAFNLMIKIINVHNVEYFIKDLNLNYFLGYCLKKACNYKRQDDPIKELEKIIRVVSVFRIDFLSYEKYTKNRSYILMFISQYKGTQQEIIINILSPVGKQFYIKQLLKLEIKRLKKIKGLNYG